MENGCDLFFKDRSVFSAEKRAKRGMILYLVTFIFFVSISSLLSSFVYLSRLLYPLCHVHILHVHLFHLLSSIHTFLWFLFPWSLCQVLLCYFDQTICLKICFFYLLVIATVYTSSNTSFNSRFVFLICCPFILFLTITFYGK